jgi:hypothetical protein
MCYPDHQCGEDQRCNDHLDQAQKNVGEQRDIAGDRLRRLRIRPQLVAGIADPDAEQHPDKDDHRQSLRAHAVPRLAWAIACVILLCKKTVIALLGSRLANLHLFITSLMKPGRRVCRMS